MLALFALVNAMGALRLLPHVPFPAELDNFSQRRIALSLHALGGARESHHPNRLARH
jgi:hypothetical protein